MATTTERKPLGQLLLGRGFLQPAQLDRALEEQRRCNHQKLLGEILVELRQCSEEQVAEALAESYGLPFARVSPRIADAAVISVLPKAFLEKHCVLPLFLVEGVLTVAVAEPADLFLREEIERVTGLAVQVVASTARDIVATVQTYMPEDGVFIIDDVAQEVDPDAFALLDDRDDAGAEGHRSPVGKLVNYCLYHAVKQGASDVYVEPAGDALRVRYRLDGRLVERMRPPLAMHEPMIARLKELAALEPARRDVPQDGVIRARIDRRAVELAVSTVPAFGGEAVTIHVDREERGALRLEKLGFGYDMLKQWRRVLALRSGLVLVAGPAGSGKNTVLYSVLRELNAAELNICSVEESIAAPLEGVRQLQINPETGIAAGLRTMLRQRPDVLMVSALSDPETVRLALDAAAGALVFAGIAAPDAPSAVCRLLHMGGEPYAVGAAVVGVLSQRLVRRLCPGCKEPYEPTASDRKVMEKWGVPLTTLHRSRGCPQCHNVGYAGRIGIHELLVPDDAILERVSQGVSLADLRGLARQSGMKSLRADGLEKMKSGLTSLAEVLRVAA